MVRLLWLQMKICMCVLVQYKNGCEREGRESRKGGKEGREGDE